MDHLTLHAVAAMARNRVIGLAGAMPWHQPADLKFFKNLTKGHPIVMGRKTWDSLGRPLPNRRNIVLSRQVTQVDGAEVISTPAGLGELPGLSGDVFIIGGAEIYALFMPLTASIYLTQLDLEPQGDAFFPAFEHDFPHSRILAEEPPCRWMQFSRTQF